MDPTKIPPSNKPWFAVLGYHMIQTILLTTIAITLWNAVVLFFAQIIDFFLYLLGIADDRPFHTFAIYGFDRPSPDPKIQGRQFLHQEQLFTLRNVIFMMIGAFVGPRMLHHIIDGPSFSAFSDAARLLVVGVPKGMIEGTAIYAILLQESKLLKRLSGPKKPSSSQIIAKGDLEISHGTRYSQRENDADRSS
jgi:uncharacterized membrane protein YsdA (DUF1294 family)